MKHLKAQNNDEYFQLLKLNISNQNASKQKHISLNRPLNLIDKISQQILIGKTTVKQSSGQVSSIIKIPLYKQMQEGITTIDKKIQESQYMLKKAKRQLILHKKLQKQVLSRQNEIKKKEIQQKTRQWSNEQKIYNQKRQQFIKQKEKQLIEQKRRQQQISQQKRKRQKQQKIKALKIRLKQMQESKLNRDEIFKESIQKSKHIRLPKFKQIEKQYEKVLQQQDFEKQVYKKNHKLSFLLDHELIKKHQINYMDRVYERSKQKGYSTQRTLNDEQKLMCQNQFKILLKRNDEQIQRERQKFKRRKQFQQRLQQIPINVDEDKKIKIQILKDKARDPVKYHFLSQKQLNDYQIFMQFKDFQLDIDHNELGKNYLQQVKKQTQQSRLKKSNSASIVSSVNQQKPFKYKNYLQEIKISHPDQISKYTFQSDETVSRSSHSKSQAIDRLEKNLRIYDSQTKNKRNQLQKYNTITSSLVKQKEIDEIYMKSIKAKLACLQLN